VTGRTLLVATKNAGKLREYERLLGPLGCEVVGPADIGLDLDVEETADTFEGNARLKALALAAAAGQLALADDSGLEVDALGGEPGVRSSRWVPGADADRVRALLDRLRGVDDAGRTARFRAVAAVADPDGRVKTASGAVEGRIAWAPRGENGFGYDPVFLVEDGGLAGDRTAAELAPAEKDRLSHRGRALRNLWPQLEAALNEGVVDPD